MKLLNMMVNGQMHLGLRLENGVLDVTALGKDMPACTDEVIRGGQPMLDKLQKLAGENHPLLNEQDITYAPAVVDPNLILCIGLNYKEHVREGGQSDRPLPSIPSGSISFPPPWWGTTRRSSAARLPSSMTPRRRLWSLSARRVATSPRRRRGTISSATPWATTFPPGICSSAPSSG